MKTRISKLSFAVVDDNTVDLKNMASLIHIAFPGCQVSCFSDLYDFLNADNVYDLALLDVLFESITSIDLYEQTSRKTKCIIYTSTYPSMMEFAFNLKVTGFLIKTDPDEKNIEKLRRSVKNLSEVILIDTNIGSIQLPVNEIILVRIDNVHIRFQLTEGKSLVSRTLRLKDVQEQTRGSLIAADRKTLINPHHIKRIWNHIVYLDDNTEVYPSRRRYETIKHSFLRSNNL